VAAIKKIRVGSSFTGSHGEVGGHNHNHEYTVVGILKKQGDVTDRLLVTPIETVWEEHHTPEEERAATAVLVELKTAMAKLTFPREINGKGEWMAAVPAIEVSKLLSLTGDVSLLTKVLAGVLSGVSALMLFLLLLERSEAKRKEQALFRFEGAPSIFTFATLFWEGFLLLLFGLLLAYPLTVWSTMQLASYHSMLSGLGNPDAYTWGVVFAVGVTSVLLSSLIPWIRTNRVNLSETLRNELD
jgi:putative ABC transport system permease protein